MYDGRSSKLWKSNESIGTIAHFEVSFFKSVWSNADDLPVALTTETENSWVFTPVATAYYDGYHPLAGHRQFGFIANEVTIPMLQTYTFYTRAIDVAYTNWRPRLLFLKAQIIYGKLLWITS